VSIDEEFRAAPSTPSKKQKKETTNAAAITPSPPRIKNEEDVKILDYDVPSNLKRFITSNDEYLKLRMLMNDYRPEFLLKKFKNFLTISTTNYAPVSEYNS